MAAVCVAIIGKDVSVSCEKLRLLAIGIMYTASFQNSPQYIASSDVDHELNFQYKVHAALDVFEEKCNTNKTAVDVNRDLYLGLLYCTETHKMYV